VTCTPADCNDCGRYPVVDVMEAWELRSMVTVLVPGVEHHYREVDGRRTAQGFMLGGIQITISMLVNAGIVVLAGGIAAYLAPARLYALATESHRHTARCGRSQARLRRSGARPWLT
jgi:hypothetical protein